MPNQASHITVCICTFKRPNLLNRLLGELEHQVTESLFTYSVVVADNDYQQSAKPVVSEFAASSAIPIIYCVEPEQNIALARNKALENTKGDFIAFIDDDEMPERNWLCNLFRTCNAYGADGVLGPVKPYFDHTPPQWLIKWKSMERPTHDTGYKLHRSETRAGNVLLRKGILYGLDYAFNPEFGTGSEDVDFFGRMMDNGKTFLWCSNAVVYELVPPTRCKPSYQIRLALLRGGNSLKDRKGRARNLVKAMIAIPAYSMALPFVILAGHHHFMKYLIKCCDHTGRLLALMHIYPIKTRSF